MQVYSTIKGRSNSDDGTTRLPEHTVLERQTVSDDGFDSFPAYSRPVAHDFDADSDTEGAYGDEDDTFHSCDSEIQSFEDAESHHSALEADDSPSAPENARAALTPRKKKRRRPKKKNKKSTTKAPQGDIMAVRDAQEVDLQQSPERQKQEKDTSKGKIEEEEVVKLSPEELVAAMELLNSWKASGGRRG